MKRSQIFLALVTLLTYTVQAQQEVSLDLAFITHLDMGLPEQDVYIERVPGSGEVWRITKGENNMNAQLYTTAETTPHDPFNPEALGPFQKGEALGLTLGQWLKQSGTGRYTCDGETGQLELSFTGLVPNGVYTMWHFFMAIPPPVPFTGTLDLPLGARDGSESVFTADKNGNASFIHQFKPCLELSDVWTTAGLAINYHSDGKTYGGHPGAFGKNAHVPAMVLLPKRDGIDAMAATND